MKAVQSIGAVTIGAIGGHAVTLAISPWLSRVYSPEAFGLLALVTSWIGILAPIATLRMELAIPSSTHDYDIGTLLQAGVAGAVIVGFIFAVVAAFTGFHNLALVLGITLPLFAAFTMLRAQAVRTQRFTKLGITRFSQAIGAAFGQIVAFLLIGPTAIGLAIGPAVGYSIGSLQLFSLRQPKQHNSQFKAAIIRHREYAIFTAPSSLLTIIGSQAPPIMLALIFNTAQAGFYGLTLRILAAPLALVGQSLGQVYFAKAGNEYRKSAMVKDTFSQYLSLLFMLGVPLFSLLATTIQEVFPMVFGAEWQSSGSFALSLLPWLALQFIVSPISITGQIIGRQRFVLGFTALEAILRIGSLAAGWLTNDAQITVLLFGTVCAATTLMFGLWLAFASGISLHIVSGPFLLTTLLSVIMAAGTLSIPSIHLRIPVGIITLAIIYGILLTYAKHQRLLR